MSRVSVGALVEAAVWALTIAALIATEVGSGAWLLAVAVAGVLTVTVGMNALALYALSRHHLWWWAGALLCSAGVVISLTALAALLWRGVGVR